MKMPFDTLITDREPIVFLEKSKISVSGSHVVSIDKEGSFNVPISSVHCLILGNGTSITAEAAAICAKNNCYVSFVKGGLNTHSIWHCGRYSNPKNLVKQINNHSNPIKRLEIAKKLTKLRHSYLDDNFKDLLDINLVEGCQNIETLLGIEGSFARKTYAQFANQAGTSFRREHDSKIGVNASLTIANNALYNYIATILVSLGLAPSIGFIHGQSRRGGLVFDLADIFKHPLYFNEVFNNKYPKYSELMRSISKKLSERRHFWTKEIIKAAEITCS